MRKLKALLVALVAACLLSFALAGPASAVSSTTTLPAAQSHHGQSQPLGYVGPIPNTGSGVIFDYFVAKEGAEIITWVGTYGAKCIYVGINTLNDQTTHDGIGRWICEQYLPFIGSQNVPAAAPPTQFYLDQHDWYSGSSRFRDCSTSTCFRWGSNPITHDVFIDQFTLHH